MKPTTPKTLLMNVRYEVAHEHGTFSIHASAPTLARLFRDAIKHRLFTADELKAAVKKATKPPPKKDCRR